MPGKRNAIALLLVAFLVGMIGGGIVLSGGGSGSTVVASGPDTLVPEEEEKDKAAAKPKPKQVDRGLTAEAVHEGGGRIVISGVQNPAKTGTRVTVQRKEGSGWADFPASSTVGADGTYSLWLQTGRKGEMSFRIIDPASGATSNPVKVRV
jgi:hypothetical protein